MYQKVVIPERCAPLNPGSSLFNRSCKPYLNLDSRFTIRCPGMTKHGFTLIELLVVVLIIGILAAVALPQYQVAVAKSRLSAVIPTVKEMANALELYYLANGAYPPDTWQDVGVSFSLPPGCTNAYSTGGGNCPNGVMYDLLDYGTPTVLGSNLNVKVGYVIWLDYSEHPGLRQCLAAASSETANKACKSLGGRASDVKTLYFAERVGEAVNHYDLP